MRKSLFIGVLCMAGAGYAAQPVGSYYNEGMNLYKAGRYSEATDAFDAAIKHHERADESQAYIDRIRKELVEQIRNRALTGVTKTTWQNKYYYMNTVSGRIEVGLSDQEIFERESLNFRPGAVDALQQLAVLLRRNQTARVEISLISEVSQDAVPNSELTARQLEAVFSYLSLAAQNSLPKFDNSKQP